MARVVDRLTDSVKAVAEKVFSADFLAQTIKATIIAVLTLYIKDAMNASKKQDKMS